MENIKRVLSFVRRALDDYGMLEDGDKIAVGVSAGKDSLTLLCAMAEIRRFYPKKFDLLAITVDMGFEGMDFSGIKELCHENDIEYIVEDDYLMNLSPESLEKIEKSYKLGTKNL